MNKEIPLVVCLDGEGEGLDHLGGRPGAVGLIGQWGDWRNTDASHNIRQDFTRAKRMYLHTLPEYGDGRWHWRDRWLIGESDI